MIKIFGHPVWRSRLWQLLLLPIGIYAVFIAFRGVDVRALWRALSGVSPWYVWCALLIQLLSHWVRAWRWNLQLRVLQAKVSTFTTFRAVMFGYLVNFALPRVGEFTRCSVLSNRCGISFTQAVGSMVSERVVDLLSAIAVTILAIAISLHTFGSFVWGDVLVPYFTTFDFRRTFLWVIGGLVALMLGVAAYYMIRGDFLPLRYRTRFARRFSLFWEGMRSVTRQPRAWRFVLLSILLWGCYWLSTYLTMLSLPATAVLPIDISLTLLVVGTFAMFIPVQGGIGAFHLIVTLWLVTLGVPRADALAYATLSHGIQTVLLLIMPLVLWPFGQRRTDPTNEYLDGQKS